MKNLKHVEFEKIVNHLKTGNTVIIWVHKTKQQGQWLNCRIYYPVTIQDMATIENFSDEEVFNSIMTKLTHEIIQTSQVKISELNCSFELLDHVISDGDLSDLKLQTDNMKMIDQYANLLLEITDEELIDINSSSK